jgi:hypothetical protein
MPNWVFNSLVVSGDQVSLDAMREQLNKPFTKNFPDHSYNQETQNWEETQSTQTYSNPVFAFWNVITPTDLDAYYGKSKPIDSDNIMLSIMEGFATGDDWYNWNVRNWGSKWDVAVQDGTEFASTTLEVNDDGSLMYRFETAWSPIEKVIVALSEMYPNLEFDYEYEEEQGWGGSMIIQGGEIQSEDTYDIPSSHADYVNLDRECVCEYEDIEYAFQDCPVDTNQYEWNEDSSEWVEKQGVEV